MMYAMELKKGYRRGQCKTPIGRERPESADDTPKNQLPSLPAAPCLRVQGNRGERGTGCAPYPKAEL